MTQEEIKAAVRAALEEHKDAFWIAAEQHYQDHQLLNECRKLAPGRVRRASFIDALSELGLEEIQANHELVSGMRARGNEAIKIGWKMIVVGGLGWIGIAIWRHVVSLVVTGE